MTQIPNGTYSLNNAALVSVCNERNGSVKINLGGGCSVSVEHFEKKGDDGSWFVDYTMNKKPFTATLKRVP